MRRKAMRWTMMATLAMVAGSWLVACQNGGQNATGDGANAEDTAAVAANEAEAEVEKPAAVEFEKLTREVKEKTFKLEYEIQYPVGGANEAQVEGIRKWINKELGGKYKGDLADGNVVLDKNVKAIASEWRRNIRQTWGDEDEMVGNMSVVIAVGCEYGQCITMTNNYEGWDGDGFGALEGATFLADGSLVTWKMFNTGGDFQKLLKKEIKSFIDETDRKNGDTFAADDLGYLLKSRVPTPQCPPMLTADGVRFVYSRYEVGEFMSLDFTVPYDIIKPLMKPALVETLGL